MNASDPGESRVAILKQGKIEEIHLERTGRSLTGNIYRGTVTNIEGSLQAAFIDIGEDKNGFLHASDCMSPDGGFSKVLGSPGPSRKVPASSSSARPGRNGLPRMPIEKMLKKGQDVLVQVTKDGIGNKGPALTTYLSLPGRYLVLMPGLNRAGVSKKIENDAQRDELRKTLAKLDIPKNVGVIARTACVGHSAEEISRDLEFLDAIWQALLNRAKKAGKTALIYQESDLVIRTVRDLLPADTSRIHVDCPEILQRVKEFLKLVSPDLLSKAKLYDGEAPIFHSYGIEEELANLGRRKVRLPSGGSLVIEQTEALVAVDVNTAKYHGRKDQAGAILQTNLEAAVALAQQLRLRDIGGLIIIDFIDMNSSAHCRKVQKQLATALEGDRAKTFITPMSKLGIVEVSRQRTRLDLARSTFVRCPTCHGLGSIKNIRSQGLDLIREIKAAVSKGECSQIEAAFSSDVALNISNTYRAELVRLEDSYSVQIIVRADADVLPGQMKLLIKNASGTKQEEHCFEEID
jgi:ribonuclease E